MVHIPKKQLIMLILIIIVTLGTGLLNCNFINPDDQKSDAEVILKGYRSVTFADEVKIVIHAAVPLNAENVADEKITRIIRNCFIDNNPDKYARVVVQADYKAGCTPGLLMVYLLNNNSTSFETAKVLLGEDYTVTALEQGAEVMQQDAENSVNTDNAETEARVINTANIQFVFSTCEEDLVSAVTAVERAYELAVAKGYNAMKLIGAEENKANVKKILTSPNIVVWGRVGHGNEVGILVDDGAIYYTYFNSLSTTALNNKVLFFNSCDVHNPPFQTSVVKAGVQKFIGGKRQLGIGPSEEVFKAFWNKVITNEEPITESLTNAQLEYYYSTTAFGISGQEGEYLVLP